jgi:uridine kinase
MDGRENEVVTFDDLATLIRLAPAPPPMTTSVVAIDSGGGAGKSTLAARLALHLGGAPIVHTDDFASAEIPLDWWPRLIEQVLAPLAAGQPPRYQRYDWDKRRMAEWIELPAAPPFLILEGVSSIRLAFEPYLAYRIWVETPPAERLRRGLERDGAAAEPQWHSWMAQEDAYRHREDPLGRANLIVDGAPTLPHDPNTELVALKESRHSVGAGC